ncbi:MAG: DUF4124 domain-containing protein [Aquisalimonadaceae bacterium]
MRRFCVIVLSLCALLFVAPVAAQVYRCDGADGKVIYADRPCGTAAEEIVVDPAPSPSGRGRVVLNPDPSLEQRRMEREASLRRRQANARREMERQRELRALENAYRQEAARGNVVPGMTASQVVSAWGRPDTISRSDSTRGSRERWVYRRAPRGREGPTDVYLHDDRVVSLRQRGMATRR